MDDLTDSNPTVRVVCVIFNPGRELIDFVDSLATATSRPLELVLVNNGGPSDIATALSERDGISLVEAGGNLGYGRAANLGAHDARSPWVVVANPDIVWEPDSLDRLLDAAKRHPEAGSLGPKLLNSDGTVYPSARAIPSLKLGAGHAVLGKIWPSNPYSRAYRRANETSPQTERTAGWLSGACLLIRRDAFESIGGFDETYFMFFEDLDLGERLGLAGWTNVYVPTATVTHAQGVSWKKAPAAMISAHHASARQYLNRRYAKPIQAPVRWAVDLGLWARERIELRAAR
ncbi:MAG: glycosyltransferase family 2 protein [Cellulomonadaceae bacterium]